MENLDGKNKRYSKITITKDGPYHIDGPLRLRRQTIRSNKEGQALVWEDGENVPTEGSYNLCRCGKSCNAPFCDGSHLAEGFDGTETASREPYIESAEVIEGPDLVLTDNYRLCAGARFCDSYGGTWKLTEQSDNPRAKSIATRQAGDCPSGRLVAYDKNTFEPLEPDFEKELVLVEDPATDSLGPIWVKAGVPVFSSDGHEYEIRNRVTLCRCGKSGNKPFCDGSHIRSGFKEKNGRYDEKK